MKKRVSKVKKVKTSKKIKANDARVSSGIPGFDSMIEGGFENNSINLIVGGSGSSKTIFAMQFLIEGIKKGDKVLYITFEEKRDVLYRNMKEFGWDLETLEKEGKFVFLEYSPEKVKVMLEEGGGNIESIILKNKIARLVIDSVSSFALMFEEELERREAALSLFDVIRKWNCTSILTLQEEPGLRNGGTTSLEFEADSIILLYFSRIQDKRERFIEVLKMRGTKHSTEIHEFEISHKGVEVKNRIAKRGSFY